MFHSYALTYIAETTATNHNLIVATHVASLMIYRDMQLIWSSKTVAGIPIAVRVAKFGTPILA